MVAISCGYGQSTGSQHLAEIGEIGMGMGKIFAGNRVDTHKWPAPPQQYLMPRNNYRNRQKSYKRVYK